MPADRDPSAVHITDLVRSCRAGESWAARALVERFQHQVYALCYRMLGQREDAEDVAQESLVRACALHNWDERRELRRG